MVFIIILIWEETVQTGAMRRVCREVFTYLREKLDNRFQLSSLWPNASHRQLAKRKPLFELSILEYFQSMFDWLPSLPLGGWHIMVGLLNAGSFSPPRSQKANKGRKGQWSLYHLQGYSKIKTLLARPYLLQALPTPSSITG